MTDYQPQPVAEPDGSLPRLVIDTDGGFDPTTKTQYVGGSYRLDVPGDGDGRSGEVRIRGRGNSTWTAPKRPWRIKFGHKTRPLDMSAKQKNWALLAEWFDRSRMDNYFASIVGTQMRGLVWTPQYRYVSLTLNGTYRGLYGLSDLVRMEAGRVPGTPPSHTPPDSRGDWLLEVSNKEQPFSVDSSNDWAFMTPVQANWVQYKGFDRPSFVQQGYPQDRFDAFEAALALGHWDAWKEFADSLSFADWWLVNEFISNTDAKGLYSSCKMHTFRGKIHMGPLWDQDLSLGVAWHGRRSADRWWLYGKTPWFNQMFTDPGWVALVKERWAFLRDVVLHRLPGGSIDNFFDSTAEMIGDYARADDIAWGTTLWGTDTVPFATAVARRKAWVAARVAWFDEQVRQW